MSGTAADEETYRFMNVGAPFQLSVSSDCPTTTEPPNLRVTEGSWRTWRLEVDPDVWGIEGLRLPRSVGAAGGAHPFGNLSAAAAGPGEFGRVMITSDDLLYTVPTGWGVVSRLYNVAEWADQLAAWEEQIRA